MRKVLALFLAVSPVVAFVACGDDAEEQSSAFIEACESFCDATLSLPCNDTGVTASQCKANCAYFESSLDGYCVTEYTDTFNCTVEGGVECVNDFPSPKDPCTNESVALNACLQEAGCARYCDQVGSCGGGDCLTECQADRAELDTCAFEYDSVLTCYASSGAVCAGDFPSGTGCEDEILRVADCLSFEDPCVGWCWAADRLGCGSGCAEACAEAIADPTCGSQYQDMLDCGMFFDAAACEGSELQASPDECSFERDNYDSCMSPP